MWRDAATFWAPNVGCFPHLWPPLAYSCAMELRHILSFLARRMAVPLASTQRRPTREYYSAPHTLR